MHPSLASCEFFIKKIHTLSCFSSYMIFFPMYKSSKSITLGPGQVGSARSIVLNDFFWFFWRFQSCLNVVEATFIILLIGTLFASLTRNHLNIHLNIKKMKSRNPWISKKVPECIPYQNRTGIGNETLHTEKHFRNLRKSTWNQIVFTIFRLI